MKKGIDVAKWQGNIDWHRVKLEGVEFAILKVINKSSNTEDSFERNYSDASKVGIPLGVYNYSYASTVARAKADAEKVVSVLNGRELQYGVWLDIEDKVQKGIGSVLVDIINAYQKIIVAAGYKFGVYTGLNFYKTYIQKYVSSIDCKFWIARYPSRLRKVLSYNPSESKKPVISHELFAWQYSSKGSIPGINGNVDLNIMYGDVEGVNKMRKPVDYKQKDSRWKNIKYDKAGGKSTIGSAGCGPTCAAMVIASLKNRNVTPVTTCDWSLENGKKYPSGGTYYSYFVPQFYVYGIKCRQVNPTNLRHKTRLESLPYHNQVLDALKKGNWVIACMGPGNWTTGGHYILIYGYENGYVYVNDPASTLPYKLKNTFERAMKDVKYWWVIDVSDEAIIKECNPYKKPWFTLKKNYRKGIKPSEYIKWLQWELKQVGFYKGKIDGLFGNGTKAAVIAYQKSKKLVQDGKVGPKTRAMLIA